MSELLAAVAVIAGEVYTTFDWMCCCSEDVLYIRRCDLVSHRKWPALVGRLE